MSIFPIVNRLPPIVIFVLVFLFFATAMAWVTGISLALPGTFLDAIWKMNPDAYNGFAPMGAAAIILLLLLGACTFAAALGMLRGRKWAWWLTVSVFVLNILGDVADMFVHHDYLKRGFGVLIVLFFLFLLSRPSVKAFFRK